MNAPRSIGLRLLQKLAPEVVIAGRFAFVGAGATLIHVVGVLVLIDVLHLAPLLANLIAFLVAFVFSFVGHYLWTFGPSGCPGRAARRFLLVSLAAFAANNLILAALLFAGWFSGAASSAAAAASVPVVTFAGSRLWAFSGRKRAG